MAQKYQYDAPPPAYDDASAGAPAPPSNRITELQMLEGLRRVAMKYELQAGAVTKLRRLEGYDIVVIADDSGSMGNPAHGGRLEDPFAPVPSRWQELQQRVLEIVEIAVCLDQDGIDLYFLNRPPVYHVQDVDTVKAAFVNPPNGYTPLSEAYKRVLKEKLDGQEKKVLIVCATDGEPNALDGTGKWRMDVNGFTQLLKTRNGFPSSRCPTSIMACTDAEDEIGWLNKLDDEINHFDVVDDYASERDEIKKVQGHNFPFSKGDYIVKTLLGSMEPLYDNLDEAAMTNKQLEEYTGRPISELQHIIKGRPEKKDGCIIL